MEDYRRLLAEIRRLRGQARSDEEERRLDQLEAAAADFSERLRADPSMEKGRPPDRQEET